MTTFPPATIVPTTPPSHEQLGALIAIVQKLVTRADSLSRTANAVQDQLNDLLDTLDQDEPAPDNVWVRRDAKTPEEVTAAHLNSPNGSCACWTVFVGREPGIYFTREDADAQVKGVPNQQYRRRTSKTDALFFYSQMFKENLVQKWEEVFEDE
ncbi:hypothetical protein C8R47DRAFT_1070024 [Mycena vitilis]|nr:hypothetical protein C8R47DRAFT_1070024 [Mycena vitilis]